MVGEPVSRVATYSVFVKKSRVSSTDKTSCQL